MSDPKRPGSDELPPGVPRWVKISGLVVLAVILALVVIMLLVGGEHGPGLHGSAASPGVTAESAIG